MNHIADIHFTLPNPSVYLMTYGSHGVVLSALCVMTKNSVVLWLRKTETCNFSVSYIKLVKRILKQKKLCLHPKATKYNTIRGYTMKNNRNTTWSILQCCANEILWKKSRMLLYLEHSFMPSNSYFTCCSC